MNAVKYFITLFFLFSFYTTCFGLNVRLKETGSRIQKERLSDYKILTDSSIKYDFGFACYESGVPPKGRVAIGNMTVKKEYEKIKLILDGQNKEGKIYAIEALLILNSEKAITLSTEEKNKIKLIIEQDFEINRCEGCFVSTIKTIAQFHFSL